jgi:tetratricopeptide (TPR) repeat protein
MFRGRRRQYRHLTAQNCPWGAVLAVFFLLASRANSGELLQLSTQPAELRESILQILSPFSQITKNYPAGASWCGAVLISDRYALAAASCINDDRMPAPKLTMSLSFSRAVGAKSYKLEIVDQDTELDYAILSVNPPVDPRAATPVALSLDTPGMMGPVIGILARMNALDSVVESECHIDRSSEVNHFSVKCKPPKDYPSLTGSDSDFLYSQSERALVGINNFRSPTFTSIGAIIAKSPLVALEASYKKNVAPVKDINNAKAIQASDLAVEFMNINQPEKALPYFDFAIKLSPSVAVLYNNRASALQRLGRRTMALADYNMAISLDPETAVYYANRGSLHLENAELDLAIDDLKIAIQKDPAPTLYRYNLAKALVGIGKTERAIRVLEDALKIDQQFLPIKELLDVLTTVRPPAQTAVDAEDIEIKFSPTVPSNFVVGLDVMIRGEPFSVVSIDRDHNTVILRPRKQQEKLTLGSGLAPIVYLTNVAKYWVENRTLTEFAEPYKRSYAIIVAIDRYDRPGYALGPVPAYGKLDDMVTSAKALINVLIEDGFPKENIIPIFDADATSKSVQDALADFWAGGRYADADRLFFYFAGHGGKQDIGAKKDAGFLVTYDFDPARPTSTSVLMSDFVARQFPYVAAKHFMVAIEACSSGLTIPGARTLTSEDKQKRFDMLEQVKAAVSQPARDLLVAGTDDQLAHLSDSKSHVGLFTQALIDGLSGQADPNKTGIIHFDELAFFVRQRVIPLAAAQGARQVPNSFRATEFGAGEVIFETSAKK